MTYYSAFATTGSTWGVPFYQLKNWCEFHDSYTEAWSALWDFRLCLQATSGFFKLLPV